jgi:hypothetical protein
MNNGSGDGMADYLCMHPDGTTYAALRQPDGSYENIGQVKKPEGKDRANIRWVDVNGDGRADMLWVNKYNGYFRPLPSLRLPY